MVSRSAACLTVLVLPCHCASISWAYRALLQFPAFPLLQLWLVNLICATGNAICWDLEKNSSLTHNLIAASLPASLVIPHWVHLCAPAPLTWPHFVRGWERYAEGFSFLTSFTITLTESNLDISSHRSCWRKGEKAQTENGGAGVRCTVPKQWH